jgi:hypothetical protein
MAGTFSDNTLDAALNYIKTNGSRLDILSQAVTAYSQIATYTLGNKASPSYTGPEDDTSGRKITVDAISDGTVTGTGTASHYAISDGLGELIVCQQLGNTQVVTSGNPFTLTAFKLAIADPTA